MDTNYVIILDFCGGYLNIIHLTEEEKKESEKYEDFESFLCTLEEKYGFRLKDCQWMTTETLQIYRYENRKQKADLTHPQRECGPTGCIFFFRPKSA